MIIQGYILHLLALATLSLYSARTEALTNQPDLVTIGLRYANFDQYAETLPDAVAIHSEFSNLTV